MTLSEVKGFEKKGSAVSARDRVVENSIEYNRKVKLRIVVLDYLKVKELFSRIFKGN